MPRRKCSRSMEHRISLFYGSCQLSWLRNLLRSTHETWASDRRQLLRKTLVIHLQRNSWFGFVFADYWGIWIKAVDSTMQCRIHVLGIFTTNESSNRTASVPECLFWTHLSPIAGTTANKKMNHGQAFKINFFSKTVDCMHMIIDLICTPYCQFVIHRSSSSEIRTNKLDAARGNH